MPRQAGFGLKGLHRQARHRQGGLRVGVTAPGLKRLTMSL